MNQKEAAVTAGILGIALLGGYGLIILSERIGVYGPPVISVIGLALLGSLLLYSRHRGQTSS
jgi:hypothetical protein